ncbi:hypothetical protein [Kribbella sp. NBC_00889]|uniref:hypothetical protein n=1 Tax=Kribbella sp. NBC_00889 TaxID=2975974 RepID=UPI00386F40F7|nr:hypothetical protein OG817_31265 [Kribbella sp. NBC_00889]
MLSEARRAEVYLDDAPENITPELGLKAERVLDERWNGWLRPLATADAFGDFLYAWRRNDPNGTWGYVTEVGDTLIYLRNDDDEPEEFPRAGETADGAPIYDLTGWVWIAADEQGEG